MHSPQVVLHDATFKVSEAGRQRVLRERRKNVHAGVAGTLVSMALPSIISDKQVRYNPYKGATFVDAEGFPCLSASQVFCGVTEAKKAFIFVE